MPACLIRITTTFALNEDRYIVKYYFNLHYFLCFLCWQSLIFSEGCLLTLMCPLRTFNIHRTFPFHTRFCINTVHKMALQYYHCIQCIDFCLHAYFGIIFCVLLHRLSKIQRFHNFLIYVCAKARTNNRRTVPCVSITNTEH